MVLFIEIVFIVLLGAVLLLIYIRENIVSKKVSAKASFEGYWSGKERRRYKRFISKLDAIYTVAKKSRFANRVYTINISEGGLKVLIAEKLEKGAILEFIIVLPDSGKSVKVEGEVQWSEESKDVDPSGRRLFYAGVRFLNLKEPFGSKLIGYIRSLPSSLET